MSLNITSDNINIMNTILGIQQMIQSKLCMLKNIIGLLGVASGMKKLKWKRLIAICEASQPTEWGSSETMFSSNSNEVEMTNIPERSVTMM